MATGAVSTIAVTLRCTESRAARGQERIGSCFSHPDLVQIGLSFRLYTLRHVVEDVGRLVNPAALLARVGKDLAQGGPEAGSTVAHGHERIVR